MSTPGNKRGRNARWVSNPPGRQASGRGAARSLRVIVILILAALLVVLLRVSTHGPTGMAPAAVQPAFESVRGQGEPQRPGGTLGEAFDARAQETERVSTPGPAGAMPLAVQPASEPVAGQLEAQQPGEMSGEAIDADVQQTKLAEIDSAATDQATLQYYLRDADPIISASAFNALGLRDKDAAVEATVDVLNDTGEPVRLQALQLLLGSPDLDEATSAGILRTVLEDPDPAFVACAAQELGGRDDEEALSALAEVLGTGDLPTRLLIVQSIANNTSAAPLLYRGLEDPDESVRSAARAILFPSK